MSGVRGHKAGFLAVSGSNNSAHADGFEAPGTSPPLVMVFGPSGAHAMSDEIDTDEIVAEREPQPLLTAAEEALRLMRVIHERLAGLHQRGRLASATNTLQFAMRDLERALDAHSDAAVRDLRQTILTALGPNLTLGEFQGAHRALQMLLACFEADNAEGDAA